MQLHGLATHQPKLVSRLTVKNCKAGSAQTGIDSQNHPRKAFLRSGWSGSTFCRRGIGCPANFAAQSALDDRRFGMINVIEVSPSL